MCRRHDRDENIGAEWDAIAAKRHRQIEEGADRSFHEVLAPSILAAAVRARPRKALDIGCGSGRLTSLVAEQASTVTAVDPSIVSVALARSDNYRENINYVHCSIEQYAEDSPEVFDFLYSNMVLMDVCNLENVLAAASALSSTGAEFHATLTHPFFWPRYSGYECADWFEYQREICIKSNFRISNETLPEKTTHIHRSLETYVSSLYRVGFRDVRVGELAGPEGGDPRFMLLSALSR